MLSHLLKMVVLVFLFSQNSLVKGQNNFVFADDRVKDKIKFNLVNNVILVPVKVNNVDLVFLLDTGASRSVIFSMEAVDSLQLYNTSSVMLRGLGGGDLVQGILSKNNSISIGRAKKTNQSFYVIFDSTLQLSSRLGVPVHGIIGYDFFKDFVVEINYSRRKMMFYLPESYKKRKCKSCLEKAVFFNQNKPNVNATYKDDGIEKEINLLLDSGSSDALWLFESDSILVPEEAFDDYLGVGINGSIYGKRAKVDEFSVGDFRLDSVHSAYPDLTSIKDSEAIKNRNGSIGGEIMRRFNLVVNYPEKYVRFKKNRYFKDPFNYNMSGLTLEHGSFTIFKEITDHNVLHISQKESGDALRKTLPNSYNFILERVYRVAEIREGSPAKEAGMKVGDEIVEINGTPAYKYKLDQLYKLFQSKEGKVIDLLVSRGNENFKVKFSLREI